MSKFWCESEQSEQVAPIQLTSVNCFEPDEDGVNHKVVKVLEEQDNPFAALSYDDFTPNQCLRHGVSYNAIGNSSDMRMGHETEMEEFESRYAELEKSFNNPQN